MASSERISVDFGIERSLKVQARKIGLRAGRFVLAGALGLVTCPGDDIAAIAVGVTRPDTGETLGLVGNELVALLHRERHFESEGENFRNFAPGGRISGGV